MNRRSFLAASGITIAALSAGCSDVFTDERHEYAYGVSNGARESHSFRIRIGNGVSESWFHDETFELDAESAVEAVRIEEVPSRIGITVDSADEVEFPWPASRSELGTIAAHADVFYEPTQHQEILVEAQ